MCASVRQWYASCFLNGVAPARCESGGGRRAVSTGGRECVWEGLASWSLLPCGEREEASVPQIRGRASGRPVRLPAEESASSLAPCGRRDRGCLARARRPGSLSHPPARSARASRQRGLQPTGTQCARTPALPNPCGPQVGMYEIIVRFLNPYTLPYLLMALAVGNLWRKRREGRSRL